MSQNAPDSISVNIDFKKLPGRHAPGFRKEARGLRPRGTSPRNDKSSIEPCHYKRTFPSCLFLTRFIQKYSLCYWAREAKLASTSFFLAWLNWKLFCYRDNFRSFLKPGPYVRFRNKAKKKFILASES